MSNGKELFGVFVPLAESILLTLRKSTRLQCQSPRYFVDRKRVVGFPCPLARIIYIVCGKKKYAILLPKFPILCRTEKSYWCLSLAGSILLVLRKSTRLHCQSPRYSVERKRVVGSLCPLAGNIYIVVRKNMQPRCQNSRYSVERKRYLVSLSLPLRVYCLH